MLLSYRILFSVALQHEYFNKDVFSDCVVFPSEETQQYFSGNNLLQRFLSNQLYVLIKDDNGKPYSPVDTNRVFRFYLKCNNPNLFNYSNVDMRLGKGQFLYLSNLANNKVGADLNLSAPVEQYDNAKDYLVGDFVKDTGSNNIFECMQKGSGHPLADADSWFPRGIKRYISGADLIKQSPAAFRYTFSTPIKKLQAIVKGYIVSGNALTEYDAASSEQVFPNAVTDIMIDLSALSYGRYKLILHGVTEANTSLDDEMIIYYDLNATQQGIIGVIEIFNFLDPADDYSMLSNTGDIKEIKYTVHFANRNAVWKYITQTNNVNNIITGVAGLSFAKNSNVFTSSKPIQLKQVPDNSFILEFSNSSPPDPIKAAYPSPSVMKCEKDIDGSVKIFFTEIHINY